MLRSAANPTTRQGGEPPTWTTRMLANAGSGRLAVACTVRATDPGFQCALVRGLVPCSGCRIVFRGVIRVPGKARPRRHIAGYVEEAQRRQGREGPTKRKVTSATRH